MNFRRLSLLWKIWLSTSVALTALFAVTGWVVQRHVLETSARNLEDEVQAGFQAYASLWRARAEMLRSVASIISSLPNVRAAFGTRDQATMRDAAQEVWARVSEDLRETAFFVVTDPEGNTIASLGEGASAAPRSWPVVPDARPRFPEQVSGFFLEDNELVQLVLTPVYVDSGRGPALIGPDSPVVDMTDQQVFDLVRTGEGHTGQQPVSTVRLSDKQLASIIAYIRDEMASGS